MFGKRANPPKGIKLSEEKRDGSPEKEKQRVGTKKPDKNEDDSGKKRAPRAANNCDIAIK